MIGMLRIRISGKKRFGGRDLEEGSLVKGNLGKGAPLNQIVKGYLTRTSS